jgi:hypothetical protein
MVSAMTTPPAVKDTIPRLHQVVDHVGDQLIGLEKGYDTFEDCRMRYLETQRRLEREGRGRLTASRVSDSERNWAPTRDCLQELMRWGAIEAAQLPSERKFVDRYREQRYTITDRGRELARLAATSQAGFVDAVTAAIIEAHPYFRALLEALADGVITYPVVSEGEVAEGRRLGRKVADWAAWGVEQIAGDPTAELVRCEIEKALDRFRHREEKPTTKELAEALSAGFAVAGFAARGLVFDSATIKALLRWGSALLVYDQSRYVPGFPQTTVLWGCSDIAVDDAGRMTATRRGHAAWGEIVARAIVAAYDALAAEDPSHMRTPFVAVHRVRAHAAHAVGVARALVDRVLADLVDGAFPEIPVQAAVYVGSTTRLPDSEPAFRYRGGRRLVMQITHKEE